MIRTLAVIAMTLLAATPALAARSYCAQVRQAVATYGYASARSYALAHYGIQAVRYGDRCLRGAHRPSDVQYGYHHYARRHYHYIYAYRRKTVGLSASRRPDAVPSVVPWRRAWRASNSGGHRLRTLPPSATSPVPLMPSGFL
jgi:hypothetical protein